MLVLIYPYTQCTEN